MKILIIEDEPALAQSMAEYLVCQGYLCERAAIYMEAMEKISLYTYDCILLDLMLPGGDGMDVLQQRYHFQHNNAHNKPTSPKLSRHRKAEMDEGRCLHIRP